MQRRLRAYERKYLNLFSNALNNQAKKFIEGLRNYGAEYAKRMTPDREPMRRAYRALYKDIIIREANTMYDDLRSVKRASIGINETWRREVNDFLDKFIEGQSLIQVDATTKRVISRILQRGIDEGLGTEEIVKLLRTELPEVNRLRALRIVRTESHRASQFGHMLGAYDSEYFYTKKWVAVRDNRTRASHKHGSGIDGEIQDLERPFSNGLQYPGDPNGSAAETVNCRCVMAFRIKRDAKGNPIKKPVRSNLMRRSLMEVLWTSLGVALINNLVNELISE